MAAAKTTAKTKRKIARQAKVVLIWLGFAAAIVAPVVIATCSPLLAWREPIYIAAGLAGVISMAGLLVQPMLASAALPGLSTQRSRRLHTGLGAALIVAVVLHVAGLWVTSPPDVVDALLFRSATPFSAWGVVAMWALFTAALLAAKRRRMRPRQWRLAHTAAISIAVLCSVVHALLIDGTMGPISKVVLCALALCATVMAIRSLGTWRLLRRARA